MPKVQHNNAEHWPTPGPWLIQDERTMCDEIWIGAEHPEAGFVSHVSVRAGCGEAAELGSPEANAAHIVKCCNGYPKVISLLRRWRALDAGSWHPDRHAADKKDLLAETRAVLSDLGEGV